MTKRYQRGNQNLYIKEGQPHNGQKIPKGESETGYQRRTTTQWPKKTKGVIRVRISKDNKTRPKDTKGVIRICISKKDNHTMAKRYQRGNQNPYIKEGQPHNGQKIPKG
jgi:hypothetical protein